MAEFTKRYWGKKAKAFLEHGEIPNPEHIRAYRYRIRETSRRLIRQAVEAMTHKEIRDKRLLAYLLDMCEEALRRYGYENYVEAITQIRMRIMRDYLNEVMKR